MPTNTSLDSIEGQPERVASAVANSKPIVNCLTKEQAFKARYGKDIHITGTYELNSDGTYKEVTLRIQSAKGNNYVITEYFLNNDTDYVLLCRQHENRNIETRFGRYLDAEVTIADLIAEE
jgi:hypothetical protein